jgi:hypothetical protein
MLMSGSKISICMFSTTLHLILLFVVQATIAQRYDPLFDVNNDCGKVEGFYNNQPCGEGFFADFREPDSAYKDVLGKKWSMIGWVDSAIESFASTDPVAATCLNESLVAGFLRICQNGGVWGFIGCAYIPCYGGNPNVKLGACLPGIPHNNLTSWPGNSAFNVRALNDIAYEPLQCSSTP